MTEFPAIDRLRRAAREFGCSIDLPAGDARLCECCEGMFISDLIEGIRAKADLCHFGAETVGILLKLMPRYHADVDYLISLLDDDFDGWPECPVLNAIKGVHCALSIRDASSRWLAEAARQIGELHVGDGPNGFGGDAKTWAAATLQASIAKVMVPA
ncbi:hypothetical protein JQ633_12430 [Bradyrhizobium tropiciagri]|uniref:hypothetical protein n=1 Tax=Bradyrhizobium tropiciagri TaxID=312253 RepID=UPI001BA5EABC|nr:hypothetical protein [Bradyrhizobium tropiciagri]MBR0871170.1 hypothetical protein [Bradyrhizobium tropiciagri]